MIQLKLLFTSDFALTTWVYETKQLALHFTRDQFCENTWSRREEITHSYHRHSVFIYSVV
jgi:hypothetical protein